MEQESYWDRGAAYAGGLLKESPPTKGRRGDDPLFVRPKSAGNLFVDHVFGHLMSVALAIDKVLAFDAFHFCFASQVSENDANVSHVILSI